MHSLPLARCLLQHPTPPYTTPTTETPLPRPSNQHPSTHPTYPRPPYGYGSWTCRTRLPNRHRHRHRHRRYSSTAHRWPWRVSSPRSKPSANRSFRAYAKRALNRAQECGAALHVLRAPYVPNPIWASLLLLAGVAVRVVRCSPPHQLRGHVALLVMASTTLVLPTHLTRPVRTRPCSRLPPVAEQYSVTVSVSTLCTHLVHIPNSSRLLFLHMGQHGLRFLAQHCLPLPLQQRYPGSLLVLDRLRTMDFPHLLWAYQN